MDEITIDEQQLALSNQQLMQFATVRKRYKNSQQLNELVISGIKGENYLNVGAPHQHIIRELMTDPDKRARHQIDVLVKATANLPFFMEMLHNGRFNEHQIQEKICKKLVHVDEAAGRAIIRRSRLASADEKADRFFIILSGRVAIYKKRENQPMKLEEDFYRRAVEVIKESMSHKDPSKLVEFPEISSQLEEEEKSAFAELESRVSGSSLW
jgi:hypothetical protein